MADFRRSTFTSLLYLCCLVDGNTFAYSPNPTVGQTLTVTWYLDHSDSELFLFKLGLLVNDDVNEGFQQILQVPDDQTPVTVTFVPNTPGYVHNFRSAVKHCINSTQTSSRRARAVVLDPEGYVVLTIYHALVLI
jgi:hypothetical protein